MQHDRTHTNTRNCMLRNSNQSRYDRQPPIANRQLELSPTMSKDFLIKDGEWTDETVTISLSPAADARWADVRSAEETMAIKVTSIDTGAGSVPMPAGENRRVRVPGGGYGYRGAKGGLLVDRPRPRVRMSPFSPPVTCYLFLSLSLPFSMET